MTVTSSRARISGIVATTTPPARITASVVATISGVLGDRSSTRLPGTSPWVSTSTRAMRSTWSFSAA